MVDVWVCVRVQALNRTMAELQERVVGVEGEIRQAQHELFRASTNILPSQLAQGASPTQATITTNARTWSCMHARH